MAAVWTVSTLERELSDGGVIVAHWRATDVDGDYSASNYGTCGFSPDASSPDFTPYDDLTESQVLGWCWANGVDQDAIEASLAAKIEADKNPTQASGVPW
tara:strand:+ start:481 stop:780 length:300 start_codon:yes stop_codon:yes gene_type:complete